MSEVKNYNEGFGLIVENFDNMLDYDYEIVCGASVDEKTYPEEYEIPREGTGTLKNQGTVGACVACSIAQVAEAFWNTETGEKEEMSEGFIYGALRQESSRGYGMIVGTAMDLWKSIGTLPKKYFDYLCEMPEMKEMVLAMPDLYELAKKYKLSGYVKINYADKKKKDNAIKDALMNYPYGLIAVSNNGFSEPHCIVLTGWNDKEDKYKYKNSWGDKFGDKGFSQIAKNKINYVYLPLFESIELPFTDVPKDHWAFKEIKHNYFAGLMKGTSGTTFDPEKPITRAEFAVMNYRNLKAEDQRFRILEQLNEIKKDGPYGDQKSVDFEFED